MASMAAILAAVSFAAAGVALRRRAAKKKGVHDSEDEISNLLEEHRSNQKKGAEKAPAGILAWRIILGVGIGFGSFQAPWQALPVLIDRKIIRDPALQLSDAELTISQTVIFVGWLLGAMALHPLMQRLVLKQVLVLIAIVMLAVSIAAITLPYFTPLSMTLLCGVRLLHGMCLNIQGVQYMYMQNCFPSYGSQLCSLVNALYAVVAVLMAVLCGSLTLQSDWRIESLTWFGLPIILGLFLGFPDLGNEAGRAGVGGVKLVSPV
ncbi:mlkA [Symbiodinium pilosum]|uniref:MlkA protein n=1 Tax=Symbiodinium pilosum TaxID=2952 RepID=A0A812TG73_SYMPI|nr:mlkA [Symbiodinium pilosum]